MRTIARQVERLSNEIDALKGDVRRPIKGQVTVRTGMIMQLMRTFVLLWRSLATGGCHDQTMTNRRATVKQQRAAFELLRRPSKGSHAMKGEAFAAFAALVLACPDLGTWERVGDHLLNMEKDTFAYPVLTERSIEAMVKEGCTAINHRRAYEIRDQDGRFRYQCVPRLDSCRWIKAQ